MFTFQSWSQCRETCTYDQSFNREKKQDMCGKHSFKLNFVKFKEFIETFFSVFSYMWIKILLSVIHKSQNRMGNANSVRRLHVISSWYKMTIAWNYCLPIIINSNKTEPCVWERERVLSRRSFTAWMVAIHF